MEIRKGKIEIELSNEETKILLSAAKVLHDLSYLLSQQNCHYCHTGEYNVEISDTSIDETHDTLNRLVNITEIY